MIFSSTFSCLFAFADTVALCQDQSTNSPHVSSPVTGETPSDVTSGMTAERPTAPLSTNGPTDKPAAATTGQSALPSTGQTGAPETSETTVDVGEVPPEGLSPGAIAGITIGSLAGVAAVGECRSLHKHRHY